MKEIFKDIKGYEGIYQVSNFGNVKSLNYNKTGKEQILKPSLTKPKNSDDMGYYQVNLCKGGSRKEVTIHRLVALTFIENDDPINKTEVNHKDENKLNNTVTNLEWCTPQYNKEYGTRLKRISEKNKGHQNEGSKKASEKFKKPVICITTGEEFPSIRDAANHYKINERNISRCCKKEGASAGKLPNGTKLRWKFKDDSEVNE